MKNAFLYTILLITSCTPARESETITNKVQFNQLLATELDSMVVVDQIAAYIPQGKYTAWPKEKWEAFKDSVFKTHQKRLAEIFEQYGYPGYDLIGEEGEKSFWLMVQHSDFDPDFQKRVLEKLSLAVSAGNADGKNFGLLTDRVRLNTGQTQIYGTQVTYNAMGQAYPRNLEDSLHVDERRSVVGLEPLVEYLNTMTQMHFEMNKNYFEEKGMKAAKLYKVEE